MITFAYPWLVTLIVLPVAVRRCLPPCRRARLALAVPFLDRLARVSGQSPGDGEAVPCSGRLQIICISLFWCGGVLSLARPQWIEPPVERVIPVRDMLLAVDLSSSMETKDFKNAVGQSVDRLSAAKEILDDFLARRKGDRVGLIVFGNAPFVQAPFTEDLGVCRELLAGVRVGMAGPQTSLGDAIGLAINVFGRSTVKQRVLIVLTDGNDTASQVPPVKAAEIARDKGIVIHTVAIGDPRAAGEDKLDEQTLKDIAQLTGGLYSHGGSREELRAIYDRLDKLETQRVQTVSNRPRRELFFWPMSIGLLVSFMPYVPALFRRRLRSQIDSPGKAQRQAA